MKATLMLEDGRCFQGEARKDVPDTVGELIFNTAVVGYQEMITDPAYAEKILVLTYPLIGNYGVAEKFNETKKVWVKGLVIKELSRMYSNWQAQKGLPEFIDEHDLPVLSSVDTRTLAVHLRQKGQMLGIISTRLSDAKEFAAKIDAFRKKDRVSLLPDVSVSRPRTVGKPGKKALRLAVLDLGVTTSTIAQLTALNCSLQILPYNASSQEIMRLRPRGVIISNGPEQDPGLQQTAATVESLLGRLPFFGIGTGHQVLCRALGARVVRMKVGHHGVNYPVYSPHSYKGDITVQHHSWVVDADSLAAVKTLKITASNLNDRTVEEVESRKLKILGVQYYPASPGPGEVNGAFRRFIKML